MLANYPCIAEVSSGTALRLPQSQRFPGAAPQLTKHEAYTDVQDVRRQFRIVGDPIVEIERQREHPLTNGNLWKDAVHQMRSGIGHSSSTTCRAPGSTLARKGQDKIVAAGVARQAQKTKFPRYHR